MIFLKYAVVRETKQRIHLSIQHREDEESRFIDARTGQEYNLNELVLILSEEDSKPECYRSVALSSFSDQELRQELKGRNNVSKAISRTVYRCRDCKHCGEGYCSTTPRWGKTTVCLKRPKPQAGNDRYYATNKSRKACEMFESK